MAACLGDADFNCLVNVGDLLEVINGWGPCPGGAGSPPTLEEVINGSGLDYAIDWPLFLANVDDENYRCWMDHYLTSCNPCVGHNCPGADRCSGSEPCIGFDGLGDGVEVTDQYLDLGVVFTPGSSFVIEGDFFPDGAGLQGNGFGDISFEFLVPQNWIAVDYPGEVGFTLYLEDALVYDSGTTFDALGADFAFAGLISSEPFDQVVLWDPGGVVFIDNLLFGVPAPSVLAGVMLLLSLQPTRRRRCAANEVA